MLPLQSRAEFELLQWEFCFPNAILPRTLIYTTGAKEGQTSQAV